jgi:uncharacterized protein
MAEHEHQVGAPITRLNKERIGLVGQVCPHCDLKIFPQKEICPNCGDHPDTLFTFSGRGEIYSYTMVYEAPSDFTEQTPYYVALIRLEEGPVITARLTDFDTELPPEIGQKVEMSTKILKRNGERGIIEYGFAFRQPVESEFTSF